MLFTIEINNRGNPVIKQLESGLASLDKQVKNVNKSFGVCYKSLLAVGLAVAVIFIACRHADHPCKN